MYQITFFSSSVEQLFHRSCYLFLPLCPSWAPSQYSLTYGAWQQRTQKTRPRFQWEVSIHTLFLFWGLPEQPNSNNRTKVALDWCKSHCLFIRIRFLITFSRFCLSFPVPSIAIWKPLMTLSGCLSSQEPAYSPPLQIYLVFQLY